MNFIDLVKISAVPLALAAGLSCGSGSEDSSGTPCLSDNDCRGDRICGVDGRCRDTNRGGDDNDHCGNSPVYGKYLWEISTCKWSMHMREDCVVGRYQFLEDGTQGYHYAPQKWGGQATYFGLKLILPTGLKFPLDPSLRFVEGPSQRPNWSRVNERLDEYDGYVLATDECLPNHIDDCAFIPLNTPFPGKTECKSSKYYVP